MKIILLIIVCILFAYALSAQNFFKPIPIKKATIGKSAIAVTSEPSFWVFRPSFIAATLFIGGTVEAAGGAGIAYQNITQKDGRNYVNYDIGAYMLAGGAIVNTDENNADIEKFAFVATALNGTVGAGYGLSRQEIDPITKKRKWKGGLALVWKINLNN